MVDNVINIVSILQKIESKSLNLLLREYIKKETIIVLGSRTFGRINKMRLGPDHEVSYVTDHLIFHVTNIY